MARDIPSWQVVGVNRTDRLYAIVEVLRATAPRARAARDLAERYEVSVRTIERDISSLQQSGVPIWATPGPGGGYSVDPSMSLPPLNFSADEATAIALALAASGPIPFGDAARKVLELDYVDRSGQRTERRLVEPYGLAGGQDHWYLMAWCRLRGGGRSFRLDRMQGARVTDEPAPERELHEVAGEIASFARETRLEG